VVFWEKGEATDTGLTAIVIGSDELTLSNFMSIKEHK
jgi:hypothetical protein